MKEMKKTMKVAMTVVVMAMVFLFYPCRVSAAEAEDLCVKVNTVEDYLDNRIEEEIVVSLGKDKFYTKKERDHVTGNWHGFSIKDPVISQKKNGKYVVYGTDTYHRKITEICETDNGVQTGRFGEGMYVDLPKNVEYIGNSKYCTLGKYKDSTQYALFREGKQLASFDVGEELSFPDFGFGIARGITTENAYMLRFTTKKVEAECVAEGGVKSVSQWRDRLCSSPGLCFFEKDGKDYIARPSSKEYMDLGQIPEDECVIWEVKGNKEKNPGYTIQEDSFENYDCVRVTYGGDAIVFKREYVIRIGLFEYVRYEKSPIERGYLAVAADTNDEEFKSIKELCNKDLRLDDLMSTEQKINKALAEYEQTHVDSIKAEIEALDLNGQQWGLQINEEVKKFLNKYN